MGEPDGLDKALAKWRKGARSRGKWSALRDAMRPYVGSALFDEELAKDMLAGGPYDDRASSAAQLLGHSTTPQARAALVARVRKGRSPDFHSVRVEALRSLFQQDVELARPSLYLEALLDPELTYIRGEMEELVRRGELSAGVLVPVLFDEHQADSVLYTSRSWDEAPDSLVQLLRAMVGHPDDAVAAGAAAVLVRFDIDAGLSALASVKLTALDSLFFVRFRHANELPALGTWGKRLGRQGTSPRVAAELRAELEELLAARGLTPMAVPAWPGAVEALKVQVPGGDWAEQEAAQLAGHEAWLASLEA